MLNTSRIGQVTFTFDQSNAPAIEKNHQDKAKLVDGNLPLLDTCDRAGRTTKS